MDDFIVDMGWTTESSALTGAWVREVPIGTGGNTFSNPGFDIEGDLGDKAYVTGNGPGNVGALDIDDGTVILTSPLMDLTAFINPRISYNLWFVNTGGAGNPPNDSVIVRLSNGITEVDLEIVGPEESQGAWRPTFSADILDFIELTSTMQFSVIASDDIKDGHIVEAALDKFLVDEAPLSTQNLLENDIISVAPNPFSNSTLLNFESETSGTINVSNVLGQLVQSLEISNAKQVQIGEEYPSGTYFITLESEGDRYQAAKIIKQ